MAISKRKPKTPARRIDIPKSDYPPTAKELKEEVNMPGADMETLGKAFFRPIKRKA